MLEINTIDTTATKAISLVDTTVTHVHVYDTTLHHVNVYDTIVTHVYDTVPPDLIMVYEKLITAQDDKFDYLLVALGIVITGVILLITFSNVLLAKKLIKADFKKTFGKEKKEIKESLEKIETDTHYLKGETARLFANTTDNMATEVMWRSECIKEYFLSKRENGTKKSIIHFHETLNKARIDKTKYILLHQKSNITFKKVRENLSYIPVLVSEKEEILKKLDELEAFCKKHIKGDVKI